MVGHQRQSQKRTCLTRGRTMRFARVPQQTPPAQKRGNPRAPRFQRFNIVREQRKIIHVTHIGRAQHFGCKMIQRIQMHIGEKLAGEIADGQAAPAQMKLLTPGAASPDDYTMLASQAKEFE